MARILDSRQLQALSTVARRRSFTLAAKDLHLSQSAVSHAIRSLEEDLGCRLLERKPRGVALTAAGERVVAHAEAALREMEAARAAVRASADWEPAALRVGASSAICQHVLPAVLREFRESFPTCAIMVEPGEAARQLELLQSGRIDLALLPEPAGDPPPDIGLEPLGATSARRDWCAAFRRSRRPAIAEETFTGLCQAVAENLHLQSLAGLA